MTCEPFTSCEYGGTVREPQDCASNAHKVSRVLATACICDDVLSGGFSLSKQWLALKNHGICVEGAVSLRSVPVHRYTVLASLNTISATALRAFRNASDDCNGEHLMSTLQEPASPISCERLVKPLATVVNTCDAPARRIAPAPVREKNSTVCVWPSVMGPHHGMVRSFTSPALMGPTSTSGASEPKKTISTSAGTFARSIAMRMASAPGEVSEPCAAKPPETALQRSRVVPSRPRATGRSMPMASRLRATLARFVSRSRCSSTSLTGGR